MESQVTNSPLIGPRETISSKSERLFLSQRRLVIRQGATNGPPHFVDNLTMNSLYSLLGGSIPKISLPPIWPFRGSRIKPSNQRYSFLRGILPELAQSRSSPVFPLGRVSRVEPAKNARLSPRRGGHRSVLRLQVAPRSPPSF